MSDREKMARLLAWSREGGPLAGHYAFAAGALAFGCGASEQAIPFASIDPLAARWSEGWRVGRNTYRRLADAKATAAAISFHAIEEKEQQQ